MTTTPRVRIVGAGRAGRAFAHALRGRGVEVDGPWGRDVEPRGAARGVDIVLVCVSDAAVAEVAARIEPVADVVVAHVAGSLGLDALEPHERRASLHPLTALPDEVTGAAALTDGAAFAVAGDPLVRSLVEVLAGRLVEVADSDRVLHHAACCVASNHLVALMGQVERIAARVGVPADVYYELAAGSLANVRRRSPAVALTGPASRGDVETLERHLAALDPSERAAYSVMADLAATLAAQGGGPT